MKCNMFEKRCDLLTCQVKNRCLWPREEANKLKSKNTMTLQEAAEKYGESFKTGEFFERIRIEAYIAGAEYRQPEIDELKAIIARQEKEYVLNGSIQEWKDYAERTKQAISELQKVVASQAEFSWIKSSRLPELAKQQRRSHYEIP